MLINQKPIPILIEELRQAIIIALNQSGLPSELQDGVLCRVLCELRDEEILSALNALREADRRAYEDSLKEEKEAEAADTGETNDHT